MSDILFFIEGQKLCRAAGEDSGAPARAVLDEEARQGSSFAIISAFSLTLRFYVTSIIECQ
ncbi:hypothetical protein D2N39_17775 [Gemmobacter lutimaris]|uniref:Uncharacterized protein n=1 Tax=Gemmobacter lutimaris TaxID=2306023 RepID=A0A398BR77_9RHOB|nr:hypothetical protein D2N39_17775 [Gemmobacter lutimaris]